MAIFIVTVVSNNDISSGVGHLENKPFEKDINKPKSLWHNKQCI